MTSFEERPQPSGLARGRTCNTTQIMREIESAFNDAVAFGRTDLAEQYGRVWLWLLQAAAEDRAAVALVRHSVAVPRPTAVIKPRHRLKGSLGVREKRPVTLPRLQCPMQPEPAE